LSSPSHGDGASRTVGVAVVCFGEMVMLKWCGSVSPQALRTCAQGRSPPGSPPVLFYPPLISEVPQSDARGLPETGGWEGRRGPSIARRGVLGSSRPPGPAPPTRPLTRLQSPPPPAPLVAQQDRPRECSSLAALQPASPRHCSNQVAFCSTRAFR